MNFLCNFLAFLLFLIDKRRKKVVKTNFELVFPSLSQEEKKNLTKNFYQNFMQNVCDIIINRFSSKEQLAKKVKFENLEILEQYKDKPVVFISAHYSNWEMLPLILGGVLEIPMRVVVRDIENSFINNFFKKNRERFNIETINKKGALKGLMKAIKDGKSVGIFVDQNTAKNEGVEVKMFGLKALHTPSAALIAKKFDVPIIPVFIMREKKGYKIVFKEPILEKDIDKSVQLQSDAIEQMVKENPKEWFWFHRRFKHFYEDRYK